MQKFLSDFLSLPDARNMLIAHRQANPEPQRIDYVADIGHIAPLADLIDEFTTERPHYHQFLHPESGQHWWAYAIRSGCKYIEAINQFPNAPWRGMNIGWRTDPNCIEIKAGENQAVRAATRIEDMGKSWPPLDREITITIDVERHMESQDRGRWWLSNFPFYKFLEHCPPQWRVIYNSNDTQTSFYFIPQSFEVDRRTVQDRSFGHSSHSKLFLIVKGITSTPLDSTNEAMNAELLAGAVRGRFAGIWPEMVFGSRTHFAPDGKPILGPLEVSMGLPTSIQTAPYEWLDHHHLMTFFPLKRVTMLLPMDLSEFCRKKKRMLYKSQRLSATAPLDLPKKDKYYTLLTADPALPTFTKEAILHKFSQWYRRHAQGFGTTEMKGMSPHTMAHFLNETNQRFCGLLISTWPEYQWDFSYPEASRVMYGTDPFR
jgi:hypothetical protein